MFAWLKSSPEKRLQHAYEKKLEQTMRAQRSGDIRQYSLLTEEAEALYQKIKMSE